MFIETHCKSLVNLNHIIWITKFKQKNSKWIQVKAYPVTGRECIVLNKFESHEEADQYIKNLAYELIPIKI